VAIAQIINFICWIMQVHNPVHHSCGEAEELRQMFVAVFPLLLLACGARKDASAPRSYSSRIGVAVASHGLVCLSIESRDLHAGDPVTLVTPSTSQTIARAKVVSTSGAGCPGLRDRAQSGYSLQIIDGSVQQGLPLIALAPSSGQLRVEDHTVTADLSRDGTLETFRSCTSSEGVHLSVWRGRALQGTRVWHQYYYLGQDIEPNCTSKDTAE
jgi:hypothetical protein